MGGHFTQLSTDTLDNVAGPHVRLGHRVGQHPGGAGVGLEGEQRIVAAGARPPKAKAVFADQGGDVIADSAGPHRSPDLADPRRRRRKCRSRR